MWTKENWPHLTSLFRPMQRIVVSLAAVKLGDMAMNTLIFAKEFFQSIGQHGPSGPKRTDYAHHSIKLSIIQRIVFNLELEQE